jgi:hypothetical protein
MSSIITADRAYREPMRTALNAAYNAMRLDECGLCIIRGSRGYVSTWDDRGIWIFAVNPWMKRRLAAWRDRAPQDRSIALGVLLP